MNDMMQMRNPLQLMALGVVLLFGGFLVIFLMVLKLIEPSFALSFLSYAASFLGMLLGLVGVVQHVGSGG